MKPTSIHHSSRVLTGMQPRAAKTSESCGIVHGSIVLTQSGEMPVENIAAGDRIITRDAGFVTVKAVRRFSSTTRAISIAAGSLGHTRPDQDIVLPSTQQVLIRDWRAQAMFGRDQALATASDLVDGEFIRDMGEQSLVLYHLELGRPHVVYAGGLELAVGSEEMSDSLQTAA